MSVSVTETILVWMSFTFERLQILMGTTEHPDGEGELEVWVGDGNVLVEYTLNSLLCPRTILATG